jgi:hypothetical protein
MRASHNLSVSFRGWKNIPPPSGAERAARDACYGLKGGSQELSRSGECALLEVTNHDTRELRFESLVVEYKTGGGWQRVVPQNWPWFSGWAWGPGSSSTLAVPRPAEVPREAPWRIQFVCYLDGETDVGQGTRTNSFRTPLNNLAKRLLGRSTQLFFRPVRMETPEIPPIENPNANE